MTAASLDIIRGEIVAIDAEIGRLTAIRGHLVDVVALLEHDTPAPAAAKTSAPTAPSGPRPPIKRARPASADIVVKCPDCGREVKQAGLGPHRKSHARAAQLSAAPASNVTQLVDRLAATKPPFGRCSCGVSIADADAWTAHNQKIPNPVGHRLIRNGEAS